MRTTVTIDDDVFQAAEAQARASGKRLGKVLSDLARRGLQRKSETGVKNRLPTFKVSANAKIIPSDRAREILAEEGM